MEQIKQEEAISLLEQIISFDTQNPPGQEDKLARWMGDYLAKAGCQVEIQQVTKERSNVIAVLKGKKEDDALLLCGHLDTVPFGDKTQWETTPNELILKDRRFYGRGTSDMKGGVAAMVYAMAAAAKAGIQPEKDIIFLGTCDEESGGIGAEAFCQHPLWEKVGAALIAEPTSNKISIASKGTIWLEVEVRGKAAHGSQPFAGINAIAKAVEFSTQLAELLGDDEHLYLGQSTCSLTGLEGGTKVNIIPERCTMTLDIRTLPSIDHAALLQEIKKVRSEMEAACQGLRIHTTILNNRPSVEIDPQSFLVKEVSLAVQEQTGEAPAITASNFFSDASIFCQYRTIPVVLFGPGDSEEAHKTNESMSVENYMASVNYYTQILRNQSHQEG